MRVLIACEESQEVCKAFRSKGHEAYSCDLKECSGGKPEWHIIGNVIPILTDKWDLLIAHPPCTYISKAGARWMYPTAGVISEQRLSLCMDAVDFFMKLYSAPISMVCIENPFPLKVAKLPDPSQIIQPYEYGHPYSKKTLLWLKGLSNLRPTDIIKEHTPYLPSNTGGKKRGQKYQFKSISQKESSKTFSGIASAMANQWG